MSYENGGKVAPKASKYLPGDGTISECNPVEAGHGTAWGTHNVSDNATPPGGVSSSGPRPE